MGGAESMNDMKQHLNPQLMLDSKVCMFTEQFVLTHTIKFQRMEIPLDEVENSYDVSHFDIDLILISVVPYIKSNLIAVMHASLITERK